MARTDQESRPRLRHALVALAAVGTLLLAGGVDASGTYTGRSANRPALTDPDKYERGKRLFSGEVSPAASLDERSKQLADKSLAEVLQVEVVAEDAPAYASLDLQRTALDALREKLPKSARKRMKLKSGDGRLTVGEDEALRYYVKIRYRVKE